MTEKHVSTYEEALARAVKRAEAEIEKEESYGKGIPPYKREELMGPVNRSKALRRMAHQVEERMPGFFDFASAMMVAGMHQVDAKNLAALISAYGAVRQSWT